MTLNLTQIQNFIKRAFPYYKDEELTNINVSENSNYYFISVTVKNNNTHYSNNFYKTMHRYYILSVHKWLDYKIIYSDSNVIDNDKTININELTERTIAYLKHLQNDIIN